MNVVRRIVVAGEMVDGSTAPALAQGFRELGWIVRRIDLTRFLPHGSGRAGRAVNRLLIPAAGRSYNRALAREAETGRPDIFLIVKGTYVDPATIARIRATGARVVLFYPDVEFDHPGLNPRLPELSDFVFTAKSFHLEYLETRLGRDKVRLVHHGFDPLIHRDMSPTAEEGYVRDVVFIGNYSRYKLDFLAPLAESGIDCMEIMGGGWEAASDTPLAPFNAHRVPLGDEYVYELARSRIAIALHHGPVRTPGWEDLVSTRTFEIPAAGTMMLHIDNPELREMFEPRVECGIFADGRELIERIRYYLDHPDARRAMARAGNARAQRDHSYWKRAQAMAAIMEEFL